MTDTAIVSKEDLDRRIDAIEAGYEFLLAYAAQGRDTDQGAGAGRNVREFLAAMEEALNGLGGVVRACADESGGETKSVGADFFDAVERHAATARAAIRLVLARADVSSQLVDNLNASIHLRALLTDLFLVDEALKHKAR